MWVVLICISVARYVVTPYPVIIWALSAIRGNAVDDHHVPQDVGDFILSILIIFCLSLVARAVIVVYRLIRHPL